MDAPSRRLLLTGVAVAMAGCGGPELTYEEEGGGPGSDEEEDELGASDLEHIVEFARESNEMLGEAREVFEDWTADAEAYSEESFDEIRRNATSLLDEYWRTVATYEDDLATFDRETAVEGFDWNADGEALVRSFEWHEHLLDAITTAAIDIIDADGDPNRVPTRGESAYELVLEEAESVIASTEEALGETA